MASFYSNSTSKLGLPSFVIPECLGVNIHFAGREQKQIEQIAEEGFRFVRMDFFWHRIERQQGRYDFTEYDELVETLAVSDIGVIFILDYDNKFYDGGVSPHTDEGRAAFASFARAAASNFAGKRVLWEIWNEPNLTQFWHPAADVNNYVKLAQVVYPALKEGDPECTVLAPALSGWDFDFIETAFELGLLEATDIVSLHAYGARKPEDAERYYSRVRKMISRYAPQGRHYEIISGEWGYSSCQVSLEKQANYLVRELLTNTMCGCRLSIWYDWHDDGDDPNEPEHHFGTVYPDFSPKPAFYAMQNLAANLSGYRFAARIAADSPEDYLLLFTNGMERRLAAWTTRDTHIIRTPLDVAEVLLVSMTGERGDAEVRDGMLEIELSSSPQYVILRGLGRRWEMESAWYVDAVCSAKSGGIEAVVQSLLAAPGMKGLLALTGEGLEPAAEMQAHPGGAIASRYTSTGEASQFVKVSLALEGLNHPLVRVVEIDTSVCPMVDVLPPSTDSLLVAVNRPMTGTTGTYAGTLAIENMDGIKLGETSKSFTIDQGEEQVVIGFAIAEQPSGIYSFSCRLKDEKGDELLSTPVKRYSIVETFADGNAGEQVSKYELKLNGDKDVRADVKLNYDLAPEGAPNPVCARIDFDYDAGQRYMRIAPRLKLPIEGKPHSAKVWVWGNGGDSAARCLITGSDDQTFQPDYGALLSFTGWRVQEAALTGERGGHWGGPNDGIIRYPITWDSIFLLDNMGKRKVKSTIYVGPIMLCYD